MLGAPGRSASFEHLADPGHDPLAVREDIILEDGAIGYGHLQGADPLHRDLELCECSLVLRGYGSDLRREAGRRPGLVGDDEPTRFCTELRIVSLSNGTSVRGSTISTEIPSLASSSATANAS
jgi:hypothetical protein